MRREANKQLEKAKKDKVITEDELERGRKQIDDVTRDYTERVDSVIKNKSDEIMLE